MTGLAEILLPKGSKYYSEKSLAMIQQRLDSDAGRMLINIFDDANITNIVKDHKNTTLELILKKLDILINNVSILKEIHIPKESISAILSDSSINMLPININVLKNFTGNATHQDGKGIYHTGLEYLLSLGFASKNISSMLTGSGIHLSNNINALMRLGSLVRDAKSKPMPNGNEGDHNVVSYLVSQGLMISQISGLLRSSRSRLSDNINALISLTDVMSELNNHDEHHHTVFSHLISRGLSPNNFRSMLAVSGSELATNINEIINFARSTINDGPINFTQLQSRMLEKGSKKSLNTNASAVFNSNPSLNSYQKSDHPNHAQRNGESVTHEIINADAINSSPVQKNVNFMTSSPNATPPHNNQQNTRTVSATLDSADLNNVQYPNSNSPNTNFNDLASFDPNQYDITNLTYHSNLNQESNHPNHIQRNDELETTEITDVNAINSSPVQKNVNFMTSSSNATPPHNNQQINPNYFFNQQNTRTVSATLDSANLNNVQHPNSNSSNTNFSDPESFDLNQFDITNLMHYPTHNQLNVNFMTSHSNATLLYNNQQNPGTISTTLDSTDFNNFQDLNSYLPNNNFSDLANFNLNPYAITDLTNDLNSNQESNQSTHTQQNINFMIFNSNATLLYNNQQLNQNSLFSPSSPRPVTAALDLAHPNNFQHSNSAQILDPADSSNLSTEPSNLLSSPTYFNFYPSYDSLHDFQPNNEIPLENSEDIDLEKIFQTSKR